MKRIIVLLTMLTAFGAKSQNIQNNPTSNHANKFEQLGTLLPTPNEYRTASGAPGPKYWQQRCDYDIVCELDEQQRKLTGKETITYFNNSPDVLTYLWLQLDENQHSTTNNSGYEDSNTFPDRRMYAADAFNPPITQKEYGCNITAVTTFTNQPLKYFINRTMMRVELPQPLKPGQKFSFKIDWNYFLVPRIAMGGRGGYENFPSDGNDLFTITQWYPRLCVYSDNQGWQNHQFTGRGEFALTFGNFKVAMTVPADHVVMATGECQNYAQVLSPKELQRWTAAQTAKDKMDIVTLAEATAKESSRSSAKKTWVFKANMVRDFAWGSSRKFVWDAMPINVSGKKVMCMSAFPKEAYNLYHRYSTKAVAHTIKTYSSFTIPYPYPVAISIEAANGMEYPMICFNYGRTEPDGTYTEGTKYGMLGVIIHEVGHNFFPMIINSDERQWSWMDEGLNTFTQYLTEELWDNQYPSGRGPAYKIVDYMKLPKNQLEPIMTNSENINLFGPNAYSKPATALNILRETIIGRENFDYAFKEYARRWAFKHPAPADFFRTMEDASAEDLDWYWRGWFYDIEPCDISLDSVNFAVLETNPTTSATKPPKIDTAYIAKPLGDPFVDISKLRNAADKNISFAVDKDTSLQDFYWKYARNKVAINLRPQLIDVPADVDTLSLTEKIKLAGNKYTYEVYLSNKGGLVMPVILQWDFKDGTNTITRTRAQVWRKNENNIVKSFIWDKEVASIKLDPMRETADIDESNNVWNTMPPPSKFDIFKAKERNARGRSSGGVNPMQRAPKN